MAKDKVVDTKGDRKPIEYKLLHEFETLSDGENRKRMVTIGQWGSNPPKVDIRVWKRDRESGAWSPGKGVSLSYEEWTMMMSNNMMEKVEEKIAEEEQAFEKKQKKGDKDKKAK